MRDGVDGRSYTKPRGQAPDYSSPVVLRRGRCTVENFCNAIHKDILKQFKNGELYHRISKLGDDQLIVQLWYGVYQQSIREARRSDSSEFSSISWWCHLADFTGMFLKTRSAFHLISCHYHGSWKLTSTALSVSTKSKTLPGSAAPSAADGRYCLACISSSECTTPLQPVRCADPLATCAAASPIDYCCMAYPLFQMLIY